MNLKELFSECQKIDNKLKLLKTNSSFSDNDNRKHVFGVLRSQIVHYEIMLHLVWARHNRTLEPEDVFRDVIGIGYAEQTQWEEFQVISKISFLTLFHFIIENMFKTILSELDTSKNPPSGFYQITKTLLDVITISDKQTKLNILNNFNY